MTTTTNTNIPCRASDPTTCRYHGNVGRLTAKLEKATEENNYSAFENAKTQLDALNRNASTLELFEESAGTFADNSRYGAMEHDNGFRDDDMIGSAISAGIREASESNNWGVHTNHKTSADGTIAVNISYEAIDNGFGNWKDGVNFDSYFPQAFDGRTELSEEESDEIATSINSEVQDNLWADDNPVNDESDARIRKAIVVELARSAFKREDNAEPTDSQIKQVESVTSFTSEARSFNVFDSSDVNDKWEDYAADLDD